MTKTQKPPDTVWQTGPDPDLLPAAILFAALITKYPYSDRRSVPAHAVQALRDLRAELAERA